MISIRGVSKIYRKSLVETTALRDISLEVTENDYLALRGPSGSGKSTLLAILGLMNRPTQGEVTFFGRDIGSMPDRRLASMRLEHIGFVFQAASMDDNFNIRDNVAVPLRLRGVRLARAREMAEASLERVGLSGRASHYPHQISGGQLQRAAIARAIASRPTVLLADEPTGALDTESAHGVLDVLEEIRREGCAVVLVTHDVSIARRAEREVHLLDGAIVDHDSVSGHA